MLVAVLKERDAGERRVAATPDSVKKLRALGVEVGVESGLGIGAGFPDEDYVEAGAKVGASHDLAASADLVLKLAAPSDSEIAAIKAGAALVSFIRPAQNPELLKKLAGRHIAAMAMDAVPRISRAQKLDALSSMANIAGYRAIVEAAQHYGGFFTGQVTAAGKLAPAKVLVIGAGVAGLAATSAARALGAIVRAFDTRLEVKDQVQSLGAEFLELSFKEEGGGQGGYAKVMSEAFIKAEMELFAAQAKDVDIIVTTALIPGKPAPKLVTSEMVRSMRRGSVIVDLAAEQGGNCELTVPGEAAVREGVTIIGYTDLPSRMARTASQLYAQNLVHFVTDIVKQGKLSLDLTDEVVRGMMVTHDGKVTWPPPPPAAKPAVAVKPAPAQTKLVPAAASAKGSAHGAGSISSRSTMIALALTCVALFSLGRVAPPEFLSHMTVFVLACFVGWQVVWNVTPALHTPLMSVTNAISGIIVIGAMLQMTLGKSNVVATWLAAISVLIATINVAGGFLVTHRMLKMFRK